MGCGGARGNPTVSQEAGRTAGCDLSNWPSYTTGTHLRQMGTWCESPWEDRGGIFPATLTVEPIPSRRTISWWGKHGDPRPCVMCPDPGPHREGRQCFWGPGLCLSLFLSGRTICRKLRAPEATGELTSHCQRPQGHSFTATHVGGGQRFLQCYQHRSPWLAPSRPYSLRPRRTFLPSAPTSRCLTCRRAKGDGLGRGLVSDADRPPCPWGRVGREAEKLTHLYVCRHRTHAHTCTHTS